MRTICFFLLVISSLSLTPLRAWSDEPTPSGAFTKTFREMRQGVFLVGDPKVGTGTAWVVSKKHRLLATNAHVADMFFESQKGQFKAMMNTTNQTWVVEKAYYHPGVRRFPTPDRQLWVRATNHKIGEVNPRGPDLAILQLSMDGPDLPVELHMAPSKTVFDLQTLPAAIMGYPGHDTKWPDPGKKALATFHEGGISRVTDYNLEEGEEKHSQFLQYTMQTAGGYSGSPILLSNGDIVGVHCMSRSFAKNDPRRIAHGVRIDALWELLALHKLTDKVALPLPVDQLVLRRYQQPDPNWELYQKLEKLRQEASFLVYTKEDFQAGIDKCDEAIQLFPRFAKIYRVRSDGWTNWWFKMESGWSSEKKIEYLNKALKDADTFAKLHSAPTVDTVRLRSVVLNNLGYVTKNKKFNFMVLDDVEELLTHPLSLFDRAFTLSSKAVALSNLDRPADARKTHDEAVQLYPDSPILRDNRASFFENNDEPGLARQDRAMGKMLRKKNRLLEETKERDRKVIYNFKEALTAKNDRDGTGRYFHNYKFELEEGYFYQIDVKSPQYKKEGDYDPLVRLFSDKNQLIQEDDDGGGLPHSRIFFTAVRGGEYRLVVTSYYTNQTGEFELTITRLAKDDGQ